MLLRSPSQRAPAALVGAPRPSGLAMRPVSTLVSKPPRSRTRAWVSCVRGPARLPLGPPVPRRGVRREASLSQWAPSRRAAYARPLARIFVSHYLPTRSFVTASLLALVVTAGGSASPSMEQSANGRITFAYRGQLIITNPDGTGQWPLTSGISYSPGVWSPDGTRLVVMGYHDQRHASLYLFDGRGREFARLTSNESVGEGERDPSFSPDGRQIAYERYVQGEYPRIWVMNVDGTSQRFVPAGFPSLDPDWSPDGGRIAWTSYIGDTAPDVWVMNYDGTEGSNRQRLTNKGLDENPSWSPDGTRIAFDSNRGGNLDVYTMKADGSDVRQLTTSPALDAIPEWSPDGKWIAFVSGRTGHRAAFVIDANGRNVRQLSPSIDIDAGPAWQPIATRPLASTTSGSKCTIWGTEEDDLLVGTTRRDVLCGLGGNDRILGGDGGDVIVGGPGNDSLVGGPGADAIFAGPGNDSVDARDRDADVIEGGGGRDIALIDQKLDRGSGLATAFDPDPGNLLRGRPVRASSATLTNPAEYAVDGYRNTFSGTRTTQRGRRSRSTSVVRQPSAALNSPSIRTTPHFRHGSSSSGSARLGAGVFSPCSTGRHGLTSAVAPQTSSDTRRHTPGGASARFVSSPARWAPSSTGRNSGPIRADAVLPGEGPQPTT